MNRRTFIQAAGATGVGLPGELRSTDADAPGLALLKLLEDSTREHLPRELVQRIRGGLHYEELLAGLTRAAARNVQPYPVVGYKYHSVMVLRSIDAMTQHLSSPECWLPIIWAADYFKSAQAEERAASAWRQPQRLATAVAGEAAARGRLIAALDHWDREAADAALINYAAAAPTDAIFSLLFAYGARDLRDIGHKAIAVANAHSLALRLGKPQSEALLRSTVAALQNSAQDPNPADHALEPDRPWRLNQARLREIPGAWKHGRDDAGARSELRLALYRVSPEEAGGVIVSMLRAGISPDALWRVLFNTAAEFVMVQPGILTVHAQTTANALHYAYRSCADAKTQQLMLLQCAALIAMFRRFSAVSASEFTLEALQPLPVHASSAEAIDEIYADVSGGHHLRAAGKGVGYLESGGDPESLIARIRHQVVYYADEPHDYKFPEAVFDSYAQFPDAAWRHRFLSAGMAFYKTPAEHPGPLIQGTLEMLRG